MAEEGTHGGDLGGESVALFLEEAVVLDERHGDWAEVWVLGDEREVGREGWRKYSGKEIAVHGKGRRPRRDAGALRMLRKRSGSRRGVSAITLVR